jgi:hypothetical protein
MVKGKPTGYQSVISDVIIVGQTIQPKAKNKVAPRISFFAVGKRKEFLVNVVTAHPQLSAMILAATDKCL